MKAAYYARCMAIYGTPQEERDIELIAELGYQVLPFPPEEFIQKRKAKGENVMYTVFLPIVEGADVVFFRALPDGMIPSGVALELQHAQDMEIPVLELPHLFLSRNLSYEDTYKYLCYVGQR